MYFPKADLEARMWGKSFIQDQSERVGKGDKEGRKANKAYVNKNNSVAGRGVSSL